MMSWMATRHFYQNGNLIALYVGEDAVVLRNLERTMGVPFVVGGDSMLPPVSETPPNALGRFLSEDDVAELTNSIVSTAETLNYKEMAGGVNPTQVASMDSWLGTSFEDPSGAGLTFTVIDFDSPEAARARFDMMVGDGMGLVPGPITVGDASAELEANSGGIGSIVIVVDGDVFVSLHAAQLEGTEPLLTVERIRRLSQLGVSRV
jgi:hypothetical protein